MIKRLYYKEDDVNYVGNGIEEMNEIFKPFYEDILKIVKNQSNYSQLDPNDYFNAIIDLDTTYKLFERC